MYFTKKPRIADFAELYLFAHFIVELLNRFGVKWNIFEAYFFRIYQTLQQHKIQVPAYT
jgi:hypothetical protein